MNKLIKGVILILFLLLLVNLVSASNITYTSGETYIRWDWSFNTSTPVNSIYIDGVNITPDFIGTYYYLQDLNPDEVHIISLYHNGSLLESNQAKTSISSLMVYFLTSIVVLITLFTLIAKVPYQQILFGVMGGLLGLSLFVEFSYTYGVFSYINLLLTILNGIILCLVIADLYDWSKFR